MIKSIYIEPLAIEEWAIKNRISKEHIVHVEYLHSNAVYIIYDPDIALTQVKYDYQPTLYTWLHKDTGIEYLNNQPMC